MRWLEKNLERINLLVAEDTQSSLTYAALECRLSIEEVCYDRLRNAHDYISQDDIRKWQPKDVINTLIQQVDPDVATTFTLSVAPEPIPEDNSDPSQEDYERMEFLPIGTQIGFDPKKLGKLWNALSNFLHVKLPESKTDRLSTYGDEEKLRRKLDETIVELERLSKGTLIMNGLGETVSFKCNCGSLNKRRSKLLTSGQIVSCINPDCIETFNTLIEGNKINFTRRSMKVLCRDCEKEHSFSERELLNIGLNHVVHFKCDCGDMNYLRWSLMQVEKTS